MAQIYLKFFGFLVLNLQPISASKQEKVYGPRGGSIELPVSQLPEGTKVTSIIWKHDKDKAAEWFEEDGDDVTYFGHFKPGTVLNKKTWGLNMSNLQPKFNGIYSAEVNNKDPTRLTLEVLDIVSKPILLSECNATYCTLTCKAITYTTPSVYTFKDNRGNETPGPVLMVQRHEGLDVVYTCNFSNPVSWKTTGISEKDLFPPSGSLMVWYTSIGLVAAILVMVLIIVLCMWRRKIRDKRHITGVHHTNRSQAQDNIYQNA